MALGPGTGADAEVDVGINADPTEAARKLEEAFERAIMNALNSPGVRDAVRKLVKGVTAGVDDIGEKFTKEFKDVTKEAGRVANRLENIFKRVNKVSSNSLRSFGTDVKSSDRGVQLLDAHISSLSANMDQLATNQRDVIRLTEALDRSIRKEADSRTRNFRTEQQQMQALSRARTADLQFASSEVRRSAQTRVVLIRAMSRQIIQIERSILRVVELTWRSAERAVRAFARGASSIIRSFATTTSAAFRGLGRALTTAFAGLGRGLTSALSGVSRALQSALRRDENAVRSSFRNRERLQQASLGRQAQAQQRFQQSQQRGLLGGLGGAGVLGGVGGAITLGGLLTSGFERAGQEESLQLQFSTLLQDGPKATRVLQDISQYARTTRFDFVEVASSVAQLTAAFGDVERARSTVEFLGDLVSVTGGGTQQFSAARLAFSQIAASGRLEGQELNQLLESIPGVPLVSILADRFFGGDEAAFQDARRNGELGGKITADAFFEALEEGANERFPELEGFSQRVGKSLGGLADNLRENFAIFGAQIISLVEGPLKRGMNALNQFFGTAGAFISGSMFTGRGANPFADLAASDPNAQVNITDLPAAAQEILRQQHGFTDENFVSAADAAEIWESYAPPQEINQRLKEFRDILGSALKTIGGVLAFAGAFKLLRLALVAVTSPLGLVVIGAGALGALWNRLIKNSSHLRGAVAGLKAAFGGLADSVGSIVGFFGEFISGALSGGEGNIFKTVGGYIADFVNNLDGWIGNIEEWIRTFEFFLRMGEGGRFLKDTLDDISGWVSDFAEDIITTLFGISPGEAMFAEAEGGNDILNLLEKTFLGPIVRFFRGPFLEGLKNVGGFGGFIGDIFNAITGDAPGGVGTRILDVLENTFLGPVVRFFRGPFANGVEAVAGVVTDVFDTIYDAVTGGLDLIRPFTNAVGDAISGLFGGGGDGGKEDPFAEETGGLSGIWEGLKDTLGNIGEKVDELLGPVWDAITSWFAETFSVVNVIGIAKDVGNIIREVGRVLGLLASEPEFVAGLAVLAASLLAAIGLVLIGVFEGIAENAPEWGGILLDGLGAAFDYIKTEGPGLLTSALSSMLSDPAIGLSIAVGGLLLGTGVGRSLIGGVVNLFRNRTESAKLKNAVTQGIVGAGIGTAVTDGISKSKVGAIPVRFRDQLRTLGSAVGSAVVGGIVAFEAGNIAGRQGSVGGLVLGLLTGAATGASIGAVAGGPIGAAIGGVVGTALAGIGAAFGANAREAEEAREKVALYVDALHELSEFEVPTAIADLIRDTLSAAGPDAFEKYGRALVNLADFDFEDFGQRLTDGVSTPAGEAAIFLKGLRDEVGALDSAGLNAAQFEDFIGVMEKFGITLSDLDESGLSGDALGRAIEMGISPQSLAILQRGVEQMELLGITEGDLADIHGLLSGESEAVAKAFQQIALDGELARAGLDKVMGANPNAKGIAGAISEVKVPLDELEGAAQDAQRALEDLLNVDSYGGSFQALADELALELPNVNEIILGALEGVSVENQEAAIRQAVGPIGDSFAGLLAAAVDEGFVTNGPQLDGFLNELRRQVEALNLDPVAEGFLLDMIDGMDTPEARALIKDKAEATLLGIAEAMDESKEGKFNGIGAGIVADVVAGGGGELTQVREFGGKVAGEVAKGITGSTEIQKALSGAIKPTAPRRATAERATTGVSVDDSGVKDAQQLITQIQAVLIAGAVRTALTARAIGNAITEGISNGSRGAAGAAGGAAATAVNAINNYRVFMFAAGTNLSTAFAQGIQQAGAQAIAQAAAVAARVIQITRTILSIRSPSQVFVDIGKQIGAGFIEGIKDTETDMATALSNAIEGAISKASETAGEAMRKAQVGEAIFAALTPSLLPGGASKAAMQLAGIEQIQSVFGLGGNLRSQASQTLGDRTSGVAEKAIIGINQASLLFADAFENIAQEWNDAWHLRAGTNNEGVPQPISLRQQNILATGPASLSSGTFAGAQNREALAQAIQSITAWGQAAIESGSSAGSVVSTMQYYIDALRNQAVGLGFNVQQVNEVIAAYGVSSTALEAWRRELTVLDSSLAGLGNQQAILQQLESIRQFGSELLAAGHGLDQVIPYLKNLRQDLIGQATAFGFNAAEINALVEQVGLSDTALANFVQQMRDFEAAANGAAQATAAANQQQQQATTSVQQPTIQELHVHVPHGDPEAIGVSVLNRLAYELVGG